MPSDGTIFNAIKVWVTRGGLTTWAHMSRGSYKAAARTKPSSTAFTMLIESLPFMGLWLSMPLESELLGHCSIFYRVHRFAEGGDLFRVTK